MARMSSGVGALDSNYGSGGSPPVAPPPQETVTQAAPTPAPAPAAQSAVLGSSVPPAVNTSA